MPEHEKVAPEWTKRIPAIAFNFMCFFLSWNVTCHFVSLIFRGTPQVISFPCYFVERPDG
jgi:hypothetical protein